MHLKWDLDLSTDTHKKKEQGKKDRVYYLIGICSLTLLLLLNIFLYRNIHSQKGEYIKQIKPDYLKETTLTLPELQAEYNYANGLIEKKYFSWSRFLSRLEQTVPAGKISITNVLPSFSANTVNIDGTAESIGDLTKFMKNIQASANFRDVYLSEQKNTAANNVSFVISFKNIDTESK